MSETPPRPSTHLPLPDQDTEPFWAAAAERRLIARVGPDGTPYHYPRHRVPGTLEVSPGWTDLSGLGTVYSFTVVRQAASRSFRDRVPYIVALVDLDEGPRMMSNIDAAPDEVSIGMRVEVSWRAEEDIVLPVFRPAVDDTRSGR